MIHTRVKTLFLAAFLMGLLAGCSRPETPEGVAMAFWQAMAEGDADDVADLSTLADGASISDFQRQLDGGLPDFGRLVVDGNQATLVTRVATADASSGERRELTTYLVRRDDQWQVDYARTEEAMNERSPLDGFVNSLNRLGEKLGQAFNQSSDDVSAELDRLAEDFEKYATEAEQQAQEALDDFAESLQDMLEELEDSINDALEDNEQAPRADQRRLQQASYDLSEAREKLDEPSLDALADSSRALAETGQRLAQMSDEALQKYQPEWEQALDDMRERTRGFIDELRQAYVRPL